MAPVVRAAAEELGFPDPHPEVRGRQARDLSDFPVVPEPKVSGGFDFISSYIWKNGPKL